jgi:hypothetical protein
VSRLQYTRLFSHTDDLSADGENDGELVFGQADTSKLDASTTQVRQLRSFTSLTELRDTDSTSILYYRVLAGGDGGCDSQRKTYILRQAGDSGYWFVVLV